MARWIDYDSEDDRYMEIGRPLIRADAKRHQQRAGEPARRAPPLAGKRVLIVKQPGEIIMRRCPDRAAAHAELEDMPPAATATRFSSPSDPRNGFGMARVECDVRTGEHHAAIAALTRSGT